MNLKKIILLLVIIAVAGCSGNEVEPPEPDVAVLDWHVQFSSDTATVIFRCFHTPSLATENSITLLDPIPVDITATLATKSLLTEAQLIYGRLDDSQARAIEHYLADPQFVLVFMRLDFLSETDAARPLELSPDEYPGEKYALQEFRFDVSGNETTRLQVGDTTLSLITGITPETLHAGKTYPLAFEPETPVDDVWETLQDAELSIQVEMLAPLYRKNCTSGHEQQVILEPPVPFSEDSRTDMQYLGDIEGRLAPDDVQNIRLSLLVELSGIVDDVQLALRESQDQE